MPLSLPRRLEALEGVGFEAFFRDQHSRLLGSMRLITGNSHEAEEVVQEAFFKVWERWDRVGAMENPTGYLYRTAMNAHRSAYRRTIRAAKRAFSPPTESDPFVAVAARDAVLRALSALTPRQRAAIVLTELHGLTTEEAAAMLRIRPGTVRVLVSKGRAALKNSTGSAMSDVRRLLEHALETATQAGPPPDDFDRFVRYRDRRRRNQRLTAGAVALVLVLAVAGTAYSVLRTSRSTQPGTDGAVVDVPGPNEGCFAKDPCWDTDMFVVRTDGTDVTRLGYDEARDLAYSWSSDGQRIVFFRGVAVESGERTDTTADIFTMSADGSDVRQLTTDPSIDAFPVFSPDGTKIAFQSDRAGTTEVYVMDADGSNVVRLTEFENGSLDDYAPTWSPDGSQIAFVRGNVPPGNAGKLWVIDADGSNGHVALDQPLVDFPSWSPDGTRIAFEIGRWPNVQVGVLELASGTVTDLGTGFHPVWAPDSAGLAISMPEGGFAILDLEEPGRGQVLSRTSSFAAAWSPDGEWIVFNDTGLTANGG